MPPTRLDLTRSQILAFRRQAGALDERLPRGPRSLRRAAWAGLQDSMPRAALLSIHARVEGTEPSTWEDSSLVQLWGPRYNVFVVAGCDLAPFTLGTLPDDAKGLRRAQDLAARLNTVLGGTRVPYGQAGHALGVNPNSLRYAAATGTVLIRWGGAPQPAVWTRPPPGGRGRAGGGAGARTRGGGATLGARGRRGTARGSPPRSSPCRCPAPAGGGSSSAGMGEALSLARRLGCAGRRWTMDGSQQ